MNARGAGGNGTGPIVRNDKVVASPAEPRWPGGLMNEAEAVAQEKRAAALKR